MKYFLLLLLTSCSLQLGPNPTPSTYYPIKVINRQYCEESLKEATRYLLSYGIVLYESEKAEKRLVCIKTPGWFWRNLNLFYISGIAVDNVIAVTDDPKVILHEFAHSLGLEHSWRGLMFPFDSPLATGFTEAELNKLRGY